MHKRCLIVSSSSLQTSKQKKGLRSEFLFSSYLCLCLIFLFTLLYKRVIFLPGSIDDVLGDLLGDDDDDEGIIHWSSHSII